MQPPSALKSWSALQPLGFCRHRYFSSGEQQYPCTLLSSFSRLLDTKTVMEMVKRRVDPLATSLFSDIGAWPSTMVSLLCIQLVIGFVADLFYKTGLVDCSGLTHVSTRASPHFRSLLLVRQVDEIVKITHKLTCTVVFWTVLASGALRSEFSTWSNISEHGLNSLFALSEVLIPRIRPSPWINLVVMILLLALYLAFAEIIHASQGWMFTGSWTRTYTYSPSDTRVC